MKYVLGTVVAMALLMSAGSALAADSTGRAAGLHKAVVIAQENVPTLIAVGMGGVSAIVIGVFGGADHGTSTTSTSTATATSP